MTKGLKNLLGYQERRAKAVRKRAPHLQQLAQALRSVPASPDPSAGCAGTVGSPPCTVSAQGSSSSLDRGFRVSRAPDLTTIHLRVGSANRRGKHLLAVGSSGLQQLCTRTLHIILCPDRLWRLLLWRQPNPPGCHPVQRAPGDPAGQGLGLDDLQSSLPTSAVLGFCDLSVLNSTSKLRHTWENAGCFTLG